MLVDFSIDDVTIIFGTCASSTGPGGYATGAVRVILF